ncbi:hypothetical protein AB0F17_28640 [Nonomuraea sp. NPDC026600]|uniref:hypothetical protein n=1 Tax=Nonomuraea sp. NPDC026600 TaxID=3155363 RepID=UPI0033D6C6E6
MLTTFTKYQREAALWAVHEYRTSPSQRTSDELAVLHDRLDRLEGGGLLGITDEQRDLLVRALLRHPKVCPSPTGCGYDDHIGDLLLRVTDATGPGEYDSEASAVVGALYRLVIGNTQVIVECLYATDDVVEGGQLATVIPWTAGGPDREPYPLRSLTVRSWFLAEVLATR